MQLINKKLMNIQNKLKAPKGQFNAFGRYKYRSCEDIMEALKPLLFEEQTILLISDEIFQTGERYYIKAVASIKDIEKNEMISCTAYAREPQIKKGMDEAQITGSTSSYARKYALNGLFLIDDTKDADSDNPGLNEPSKKETVKKETENKCSLESGPKKVFDFNLEDSAKEDDKQAGLSREKKDLINDLQEILKKEKYDIIKVREFISKTYGCKTTYDMLAVNLRNLKYIFQNMQHLFRKEEKNEK